MCEHRVPYAKLKFMQEIYDEKVVEVLPYLGQLFRECVLLDVLVKRSTIM